MQYKQDGITENQETNVHNSREHIECPICSQDVETFVRYCSIWCNEKDHIIESIDGTYYYLGKPFYIEDGWFIYEGLKLELPKRTSITVFERVVLAQGISLKKHDTKQEINAADISYRELLHLLTMMALKDMKLISNSFSLNKQLAYGENVFEVYYAAISGSGRINAKQKNLRWLNEQDTKQLKSKLFKTSGYLAGVNSIKYEPTELAEKLVDKIFELFNLLKFKQDKIEMQALDFIVTMDMFMTIKLRDVILLLSDCIGYDNGFVIRPRVEDRQYSRVYSVFTSISSNTRRVLGYYNYDIGAALQTITLRLVKNPSEYPLHEELVHNKTAFRSRIQDETGQDLNWVKKELSKIDNMDNLPKRYEKYPTLKDYFKESEKLRKEVISTAEPVIYQRAVSCAKPKWKKVWVPNKKEPEMIIDGKKESSVFFFIWTQWERQIRESMMSCFDKPSACHQVHDAVYSKQKLEPKVIEEKVLSDTGFAVQISTD